MAGQPRTRPRRFKRVRYTYESDSDSDFPTPSPSIPARPSRSSRRIQTYQEYSGEDPFGEPSSSASSPDTQDLPPFLRSVHARQAKTAIGTERSENSRKRQPQPGRSARHAFPSFKRQKTNKTDGKPKISRTVVEIPGGSVPPWQQLPYLVLQKIMRYASYPLYEQASRSTSSINWLCGTSTLCRSFNEACIAALLYSPPLYPSDRAHGLLRLLKKYQDITMTKYQKNIKSLDIEVKHLLIKKNGIDIERLLDHTPLLERLRLYSNLDDFGTVLWAQPSVNKVRWAYPEKLFDKLDNMKIRLKIFEWNGRFPTSLDVLQRIPYAHNRACMSMLQEVSFVNLTLPEKIQEHDHLFFGGLPVSSLDKLRNLKQLSFRNCNIVDNSNIARLPSGLHHLEFANCSSLTSLVIEKYLSEKGSTLNTLRLVGNQAMSLGFFAGLKTFCPNLRHLYVDLTYTDPTSYCDRDPLYEELLPGGSPTWPSSLVDFEVENLRQLSAVEAEDFFDSLVSAAEDLPYLKILSIKAILKDASWRDRAQMRKKWLPKLKYVFLNTSKPNDDVDKQAVDKSPANSEKVIIGRQSTRIANAHLKKLSLSDITDESDAGGSQGSAFGSGSAEKLPRQGRCDIVHLMLSDQRPAQEQFKENDFLDDEPSGDEEWTGKA